MTRWWARLRVRRCGSGPLGPAVTGLPSAALSWVDPHPPKRRVVLGFLDGSVLELDPDSASARKLEDHAASMILKD